MKTLRSYLGDFRRNMLCSMHRRSALLGNSGPIISFTFDDFPRSAASVGGRILQDFGARGTYYVACGLMNVQGELGEIFHRDDLYRLLDEGHELGTQTFAHGSARKLSLLEFCDDAKKGMESLEEITRRPAPNFCYPYGAATLGTKKHLGRIFGSSRGIIPGLNGPDADLNLLRANPLYGGSEQAQRFTALIRENFEQKGWLIFYTHDIRRNPSAYGCTPELLETVVSAAAASSSEVLTIEQALQRLSSQSAVNTQTARVRPVIP